MSGGLYITTPSLPTAQVSQAYTFTLAASGGTGSGYTWSITSGTLPGWATLTAATGVISGTPTGGAAVTNITAQVTDSGSHTAAQALILTVITGPVVGPAGSWTLAFADEFNVAYPTPYGTGPNPNVWADHGLAGDMFRTNNTSEQEWCPHGYYGYSVSGSVLSLQGQFQNPQNIDPTCPNPLQPGGPTGTFTGCLAASYLGFSQTYGYFEAMVKQPSPASAWCGPWMLARNNTWPPEIDIAEWQPPGHSGQNQMGYFNMSHVWQSHYQTGDTTAFHVYGVNVTPSAVTFYVDGSSVSTDTYDGTAVPWYVLLQFAVEGASGGSGYPASFQVDYVRCWVPAGVPAVPVISSISPSTGIPTAGSVTVNFGTVAGATSYRVTASPTDSIADNNSNNNITVGVKTGASGPLTVTGLQNGCRYNFTVCAINGTGYSPESAPAGPQVINIQVATLALPDAPGGQPYTQGLTAQAGFTPYTWSVASGSLPAGLSLNSSTGVISGTPVSSGTSSFTVKVTGNTNWSGGTTVANSATRALSIVSGGGGGGIWQPPVFSAAYTPASDWSSAVSPKTTSVTASPGNVILVLGGTDDATVTLTTPTDGTNTYALQQNSLVASTCAGYSWATGAPAGQLTVTTSSLPAASTGTPYSAGLAATGGTGTGYTWSITSGALPSWASLNAATGVISGTPGAAGTSNFTVQVQDSGGNRASKPLGITVGTSGWTLVASETFATNTLSSNFVVYNNGQATSYEPNSWMASQVSINTTAKQLLSLAQLSAGSGSERVGGAWYWTGGPSTPAILQYGAWEVDMLTQPGAGYAPVLLMWPYPDDNVWPTNGEIDFVEQYASTSSAHTGGQANFHLDTVAGSGRHLSFNFPGTIDWSVQHTARVEWQPSYISVFVDGTLVANTTDTSYIPHTKPMRLTCQQEFYGVSDGSITSLSANTIVSGLRAYTFTG